MTTVIEAETLTTFELSGDGARIRFNARNVRGEAVCLSLPTDVLRQMVMTLPRIAQQAMRLQHGDDSLRIVFPAGSHHIERGVSASDTFIVTLSTPDGFEVSFAVDSAKLRAMEHSFREAAGQSEPPPVLN